MKKKIVLVALLAIIIIFVGYIVVSGAITIKYTRNGGNNLYDVATLVTDDLYLDGNYNAKTINVPRSQISVYKYGTTTELECTGDSTKIDYGTNKDKYFLTTMKDSYNSQYLYYTIKIEEGNKEYSNIATFLYRNSIQYKGKKYNLRLNLKRVTKVGDDYAEVRIGIARREEYSTTNVYDLSTYTMELQPAIRVAPTTGKVETEFEYIIEDSNGTQVPVSGIFGAMDIDCNQGFFIKNFQANADNVFMDNVDAEDDSEVQQTVNQKIKDVTKYKYTDNGTYIYTTTEDDIGNKNNAYLLSVNKSKLDVTLTFDSIQAISYLRFIDTAIKVYKNITTSVIGGTITPSITDIRDNENKTITYAPNNAETQYLKSVKVDGVEVDKNTYENEYTFSNITNNHEIEVEYGDKYAVTYDAKGGSPTPDTEYVLPNEKATRPSNPSKTGYTFKEWRKTGATSAYNFNTSVTSNINLDAQWTPVQYTITYVLNGGTNDSRNPSTYTVEDTINFEPATRTGYDFKGWYRESSFTTKVDSISNSTGNITLYAKWEAKGDTAYKVEHYKENASRKL